MHPRIGLALAFLNVTVDGPIMNRSGSPLASGPSLPSTRRSPLTVARAMTLGSLSFATVSVLAYSIWAFRLVPNEAALYATTALVYLVLAGVALSWLLPTPGAWRHFPLKFAVAFLVYAVAWCALWFGLKGKHHADLWGAAMGLAGMTWVLRAFLALRTPLLPLFAVLFTCHTLGYTLGDELYAAVRGPTGRLLWGAAHGLGFGAGLGFLLQRCHATEDSVSPSA